MRALAAIEGTRTRESVKGWSGESERPPAAPCRGGRDGEESSSLD